MVSKTKRLERRKSSCISPSLSLKTFAQLFTGYIPLQRPTLDTCHCGPRACPTRQLRPKNRMGKITLLALIFLLLIAVLIGLVGNAGHAVNQKVETQNAADALAFSSTLWMARGLNTVTASNHLVGEATALSVLHEAIGGPELRLGLKKNTSENQQLDRILRSVSKSAPIGRIPSPYVPLGLTNVDKRLIEFVVRRTSPSSSQDLDAFAMLYDARLTLKRELAGWLIAKSIANLAYLIPPPFGYLPAIGAYAVHIAASSQVVLIGKEWLLLEVLEKYAAAAAPIQIRVIESQLIPALNGFAAQVAGFSLDDLSDESEGGFAVRGVFQSVESLIEEHQVEGGVFPSEDALRLPVVFEPSPNMQGRQGEWPSGWGSDKSPSLPSADGLQRDMESQLDKALDEMQEREDVLLEAIEDLDALRDEVQSEAEKVESPEADDYDAEIRALDSLIADLRQQQEKLRRDRGNVSDQRDELLASFQSLDTGPSQNLSLQHVPRAMDPDQERQCQWVRATMPNVDALRGPLLGLFRSQLPKSKAAEHFEKWTNRYTLIKSWQFRSGYQLKKTGPSSAQWNQDNQRQAMLVMPGAYRTEQANKGSESWTGSGQAAQQEAEERFTVVGVAHRSHKSLFAQIVYPQTHSHGLTSLAQSIVYNANPQQPQSGASDTQAVLGWDTLNWDFSAGPPVLEWGGQASLQSSQWPWELFDGLDAAPKIKLNWQSKLVPLTSTRLQHAAADFEGPSRQAIEFAAEYESLLHH